MAHFDFGHGQKMKILKFFIRHKSFVLLNDHFVFYENLQNFHFLAMSKVKIGRSLPKWKTGVTNFFEYSIVSDKLPEN